jgi:hypothetical protein
MIFGVASTRQRGPYVQSSRLARTLFPKDLAMALLSHHSAPPARGFPSLPDDVGARVVVGVVSLLTFGLAAFLTATVVGGLALGTSVVSDAGFTLALVAVWTAAVLGLVATRWLYAPERMGDVARFAAIVAVSLLVVAALALQSVGAILLAAVAVGLAISLAALAARRGDAH